MKLAYLKVHVIVYHLFFKTLSWTCWSTQLQDSFKDSQLEDHDSNPEDEVEATSVPHSLVFKCIGCNKSPDYRSAFKSCQ